MAFDTIEEIKAAIKDKEDLLSNLRTRMQKDFGLFTLDPYVPKNTQGKERKGYAAYTSTAPRNYFDKVLDGVNGAPVTIQIKLPEKATVAEKEAVSIGELFLFGALADIDRRQARRGEPPLKESLGFLECSRGRLVLKALIYTPKGEDDVEIDVQAWDPMHVTWEQGVNGLVWVAYKRKATKAQILSEYGIEIKDKNADIIDFFDEEKNSVIIGVGTGWQFWKAGGEWAKEPTPHNIGHVPVYVGAVGSMPTIQTKDFEPTVEYQGESVWGVARDVPEARNMYVSWLMDIVRRSVAGSLTLKSPSGTADIEGDPYEAFQVVKLTTEMELDVLTLPQVPPETAALLGIMEQDWAQSTLPYPLAYGGTRQAMSGRALRELRDATKSVYSPRTSLMAQTYTWLAEELLSQFANKGTKEREMMGYDKDAKFFKTTVKPSAIDPNWVVNVLCEPPLPRDEESEVAMANALRQPGGASGLAILSDETILEGTLKVKDPRAELNKVLAEKGKAHPIIMATLIADAMEKTGDKEGAKAMMAWIASQSGGAPGGDGAAPGGGAPPIPPELVAAIIQALATGGSPEEIEPIIQALMQAGHRQLAELLLKALGAPGSAGGPPGPQGAGPQQGGPPEILDAVLQVLRQSGQEEMAQRLAAALSGEAPMTPELIEAVLEVLVQAGQQELAEAFVQALREAPSGAPTGPPERPVGRQR